MRRLYAAFSPPPWPASSCCGTVGLIPKAGPFPRATRPSKDTLWCSQRAAIQCVILRLMRQRLRTFGGQKTPVAKYSEASKYVASRSRIRLHVAKFVVVPETGREISARLEIGRNSRICRSVAADQWHGGPSRLPFGEPSGCGTWRACLRGCQAVPGCVSSRWGLENVLARTRSRHCCYVERR